MPDTNYGELVAAKNAGNCSDCGGVFYYGDDIVYVAAEHKAYHIECADRLQIPCSGGGVTKERE